MKTYNAKKGDNFIAESGVLIIPLPEQPPEEYTSEFIEPHRGNVWLFEKDHLSFNYKEISIPLTYPIGCEIGVREKIKTAIGYEGIPLVISHECPKPAMSTSYKTTNLTVESVEVKRVSEYLEELKAKRSMLLELSYSLCRMRKPSIKPRKNKDAGFINWFNARFAKKGLTYEDNVWVQIVKWRK